MWMLSFESSDVAQLGGLGSAVAEPREGPGSRPRRLRVHAQPREAQRRSSKGEAGAEGNQGVRQPRRETRGRRQPLSIPDRDGGRTFRGRQILLAKGLDQSTSQWLDRPQIYDGELTYQKIVPFRPGHEGVPSLHPEGAARRAGRTSFMPTTGTRACGRGSQAGVHARESINVPLVFTIHLSGLQGAARGTTFQRTGAG